MPEELKKICPLSFRGDKVSSCYGEKCMFYILRENTCCLVHIASCLNEITELTNGEHNLIVDIERVRDTIKVDKD